MVSLGGPLFLILTLTLTLIGIMVSLGGPLFLHELALSRIAP